jgi:hypothetical protein
MTDAYIRCRTGNMMISHGDSMKNLVLYPPEKPSMACENPLWVDFELEDENVPTHFDN